MLSHMFFSAQPPKPFTGTCVSREVTDPRKSGGGRSEQRFRDVPLCFLGGEPAYVAQTLGHVMSGWTVMCGAEMQLSSTYRRTGGVRPPAQASSTCSPRKSGTNAVMTLILPFAFHPALTCFCMESTSSLADDNLQNTGTVIVQENRQPCVLP